MKSKTSGGSITNDSEYVRDLVCHEQDIKPKLLALQGAVQEGLDSGVSNRTVEENWAAAEGRHQANDG